ncbi:DUF2459 domain-containing protein [Neoroseomonas oryzicola]|uniref:DUF2459 domain-containing protein n=1 Tax=Neoroseomonas oryzicola TaxID=535904 RepID=A0A9X9WHI3_9PROT|nr:DUF2459 domain-containing protein [Neoroseomonas oryzicola]MBR0659793.1 DUF2459 domain-containing protein [Neoroseomonas oryzicola]NKE19803.1 DUF2459 domain-containing protein [Neoroseomonas oryzicola]
MPFRRAVLAAALGGCAVPPAPPPRPHGRETVIVSAESWHTDLCLPGGALGGTSLAPLGAAPLALGFGLESWMRAARPGSGDALAALGGGPAVVWLRALAGPVPPGAEETLPLRLPEGGISAIAAFVADQLAEPLPVALPIGGSALLASRLAYAPGFTCNTWVMRALAEAGLPVPVAGIRLRGEAMAALRAEAARQAGG